MHVLFYNIRHIVKKNTINSMPKGGMRKRTSKAVCRKETLKKYRTRPSPPYRAKFCVGKTRKGNDGHMYRSKSDFNFAGPRWVRINK